MRNRKLTGIAHLGSIRTVVLTADGCSIISAGADRKICVWDVASGRHLRTLAGHTGGVNNVSLSGDGKLLLSCSMGILGPEEGS